MNIHARKGLDYSCNKATILPSPGPNFNDTKVTKMKCPVSGCELKMAASEDGAIIAAPLNIYASSDMATKYTTAALAARSEKLND